MNELLSDLHLAIAEELLRKVLSGDANAADLNVARAFLKDNGVDSTLDASIPMENLAKSLPFNVDTGAA